MRYGHREVCLDHETGRRHPESPDRIRAVRRALADHHGVTYAEGGLAAVENVLAVHDGDYVDDLREFCADGGGNWDADTVAVEETFEASLASAGLAEWAVTAALDGASGRKTPFSLGRPPGHHAVGDDAMGFCFFNNAAVAAQTALDERAGVDRVAILDWDVHHGNGTQDIFYDRGDVFYVSIHESGLYPGTGKVHETGEGEGEGANLNVPFPPGTTHDAYLTALGDVVAPALYGFDPDLLVISAGFDAHEHDPISRMRVSTEGYGLLTDRVRAIADETDAALAFVLEGGYDLDTLASSVSMVHEVFDGYEPVEAGAEVGSSARNVIDGVAEQGFGE
jgi:acetoin utilization deacetylase AcuC-like enzyme